MKIAIIGAGVTGLTAGYRLSKLGHQVTIFEKEKFCGGLAAGFKEKGWNWPLEKFYHHLFTSDNGIKKLLGELGLSDKLFYQKAKTSILASQGDSLESFEFDSPFSLLRFSPLSFPNRLRTGLVTAYLKLLSNWQPLEQITASSWLQKAYGEKVFKTLWEPLLTGKFGQDANSIPMSWFWARIKKRSAKLGYLEGGFQTLIDKLVDKIKEQGGKIILGKKGAQGAQQIFEERNERSESPQGFVPEKISVERPKRTSQFDKIIVTTSPQIFFPQLKAPKMLGALNLILTLREPFLTDGTYWLNINDPSFPFVAVVEHTNLVNPKHYGGNHLLYVGSYYPQTHRYFKMTKEEIFQEFLPFLHQIHPLPVSTVLHRTVTKNLWAQPIIPLNYSQDILPHRLIFPKRSDPPSSPSAAIRHLPQAQRSAAVYLANMSQVYPWDRGTNYSVELGEKIAKIVQS